LRVPPQMHGRAEMHIVIEWAINTAGLEEDNHSSQSFRRSFR